MNSQANPEFWISPLRRLTQAEMTYFFVANQPAPFADLDRLLESLYAAKALAGLGETGPDITRYYPLKASQPGEPDLYQLEVGIPVKPGTRPAGAAQVKQLPPFECAGMLLWGSLAHITQAYQSLIQAIREAGLEQTGESREWNYWFESVDSPVNLMGLFMAVR